jgi:hypothetical protein
MSVSLEEHRLGGLRWIVLRGPAREAFLALGEHTRDQLSALSQTWPVSDAATWRGGGNGMQRSARTLEQCVGYLRTHPSAGGFAYTIGDQDGRIVGVETKAGLNAFVEAGPGSGPLLWHTNHARYLPGDEPKAGGSSVARGQTLAALDIPATDPGPAWFLRVLAGASLPEGVRCDPAPGNVVTTLCTFVADLTAGEAVIAARDSQPVAIPLADLAAGYPHAQRVFAAPADAERS